MAATMTRTVRFTPKQRKRIEMRVEERDVSANRLVVEIAMGNLDGREWSRNDLDIQIAKTVLFAGQVLRRDLFAAGLNAIPAGEFARSSAVAAAEDRLGAFLPVILSKGHIALIEEIYRFVHVMATLERDKLLPH